MLPIYKLLKFIFRYLVPSSFRYPLARTLASFVFIVNIRRRRVILGNLTPLVGAARAKRLAPRLLGNFSMTTVDFFCPRRNLASEMHEENWSVVEKAYRKSKRVLL